MYEIEFRTKHKNLFFVVVNKWTGDIKDFFFLGEDFYFKHFKDGFNFLLQRALDMEFGEDKAYNSQDFRNILKILYNFESNPTRKKRLKIENSTHWKNFVTVLKEKKLKDKLVILENKITEEGKNKALKKIMETSTKTLDKKQQEQLHEIADLLDTKDKEKVFKLFLHVISYNSLLLSEEKIEKEKRVIEFLQKRRDELRGKGEMNG